MRDLVYKNSTKSLMIYGDIAYTYDAVLGKAIQVGHWDEVYFVSKEKHSVTSSKHRTQLMQLLASSSIKYALVDNLKEETISKWIKENRTETILQKVIDKSCA